MKILKRLVRITRIALLAILAVYAGASLRLVNLSDPVFKPVTQPAATAEMSEMLQQDEAFVADQFEPVVTKSSGGQVILVEGETHHGICYNGEAMAAAGNWLAKNGLTETKLSAR